MAVVNCSWCKDDPNKIIMKLGPRINNPDAWRMWRDAVRETCNDSEWRYLQSQRVQADHRGKDLDYECWVYIRPAASRTGAAGLMEAIKYALYQKGIFGSLSKPIQSLEYGALGLPDILEAKDELQERQEAAAPLAERLSDIAENGTALPSPETSLPEKKPLGTLEPNFVTIIQKLTSMDPAIASEALQQLEDQQKAEIMEAERLESMASRHRSAAALYTDVIKSAKEHIKNIIPLT